MDITALKCRSCGAPLDKFGTCTHCETHHFARDREEMWNKHLELNHDDYELNEYTTSTASYYGIGVTTEQATCGLNRLLYMVGKQLD